MDTDTHAYCTKYVQIVIDNDNLNTHTHKHETGAIA